MSTLLIPRLAEPGDLAASVKGTKTGTEAPKNRSRQFGRPSKLNRAKMEHALGMIDQDEVRDEVARLLDLNPSVSP